MKDDSRKVIEGDTFISLTDNEKYIEDAIKRGASKIICKNGTYNVNTINVYSPRLYLEKYLDDLYKEKFNKIKIIGITGTNGKTTSSYLLWQILNKLDIKCGYIGTIGFYIKDKIKNINNTTPDMLDLYSMINECIDNECSYVVMEISSQALSYNRIGRLLFDYVVFTNLTEDHLDYHKDMESYALAKQKLFYYVKNKAIINYDDKYKDYFILDINDNITYGLYGGDYHITEYSLGSISKFRLNNELYVTNLIGKYNIYNLLISKNANINFSDINYDKDMFKELIYPDGRMDIIEYKNNKIIIDYAHTPDGVRNIINSVKELNPNNIITIIGCGGNRDSSKRSMMGTISTNLSDYVIFTNDNPRNENELSIIDNIIQNIDTDNYEIITNREKAIIKGIQMLSENDILLVLGKGHEDYQIIGDKRIPFSDKETVLKNI